MATVVISPFDVATFPAGGGHFWVYTQYAQGLLRLGCEVIWLERVPEGLPEAATATFFDRMERYGLGGNASSTGTRARFPRGSSTAPTSC